MVKEEITFKILDEKGLKEILINEKSIGIANDFNRTAILNPKKLVIEDYIKMKDELTYKGYEVIN